MARYRKYTATTVRGNEIEESGEMHRSITELVATRVSSAKPKATAKGTSKAKASTSTAMDNTDNVNASAEAGQYGVEINSEWY